MKICFTISVYFLAGPDCSIRLNTSSPLFVDEGNDVTVACAANCFLKCAYTWTFGGQTVSNTSILSVRKIDRPQTGTYTCTAVNPDTADTANTTVYMGLKSEL